MNQNLENIDDYYGILNLSHNATPAEIIQAYREMKQAFEPGSIAAYSLYSEHELGEMIEKINHAYLVLSNSSKREAYNRQIGVTSSHIEKKVEPENKITPKRTSPAKAPPPEKANNFNILISTNNISGQTLREVRESQGLSLDDIAARTKISIQYLQAIEQEDIDNFPAKVYLKSFLKQYAEAISLDSEVVVKAYNSINR